MVELIKPKKVPPKPVRHQGIEDHHQPQRKCVDCPFRGPKVGSKGDPQSPIVFVAESPGQHEVKTGIPLSGPSGQVFHQTVPEDANYYVLNSMECSPPTGKHKKTEEKMTAACMACHDNLIDKVKAYPRRMIIAMGNSAVRSLTGNHGIKITQARGSIIQSPLAEMGIMPVIHPAALMRGTGSYRQWKEDIEYALDIGNGGERKVHLKANLIMVSEVISDEYLELLFTLLTNGGENMNLTCDLETSSLQYYRGRVLTIGITPDHDMSKGYCFLPHHLPQLKKYFENRNITWNWHNGKFDVKWLKVHHDIDARVDEDTMLLSYSLDESGGIHDLETISRDLLDAPSYKHMLDQYLPNKNTSYEVIPLPKLAEYQAIDTSNTAQDRRILRRRIETDPSLMKMYNDLLIPASEYLSWVEINGMYVDQERVHENDTYFKKQLEESAAELHDIVGMNFNPGSPQQVSEIMFKKLGFKNVNKGSTDKGTIDKLLRDDPDNEFLRALLRHRAGVKMHGTYVKGLLKWIHTDGRIHSNYKIHGTRTGRLASAEPNMQNPPRLPQIRGAFMAPEGFEILEVDLSQAELRSLTNLSGDPILTDLYLNNIDLHTDLANYLFPGWDDREAEAIATNNQALKSACKEQRTKCKNVNFGIIYGITEFGLSEQIKDTTTVARSMLKGWFERYKVAGKYIKKCRMAPVRGQNMTTIFGRRKRAGIVSKDNIHFLQNEAANFPHQSIASDITLLAGIRCWKKLDAIGVKVVNTVHDSIIMEVPITPDNFIRRRAATLVAEEMERIPVEYGIDTVPFVADSEYGERWGTLKSFDWREAS